MQGLRDIKGIVKIPDNSLEILLTILTIIFLATIVTIIYYKFYKRKKRKRLSKRELAYQRLKNLNFDDVKNSIYTFTIDGNLFVNDKNEKIYHEIENKIEKYKYKKDVPNLDQETVLMMKKFIKDIS